MQGTLAIPFSMLFCVACPFTTFGGMLLGNVFFFHLFGGDFAAPIVERGWFRTRLEGLYRAVCLLLTLSAGVFRLIFWRPMADDAERGARGKKKVCQSVADVVHCGVGVSQGPDFSCNLDHHGFCEELRQIDVDMSQSEISLRQKWHRLAPC